LLQKNLGLKIGKKSIHLLLLVNKNIHSGYMHYYKLVRELLFY